MSQCLSIRCLFELLGLRSGSRRAPRRGQPCGGDAALPSTAPPTVSAGAHTEGCFTVTVFALSAEARVVTDLQPSSRLLDLKGLVGQAFAVPPAQVQLILGARLFTTADSNSTLQALGVGEGSELTFIRQRFLEVAAGMRVELCLGGTEAINGTYVCCPKVASHGDGPLVLRQEGAGPCHWIAWWRGSKGLWPSGWYVEGDSYHASYYHPSENPSELPPDLWEVYTQHYSRPGALPVPGIRPV